MLNRTVALLIAAAGVTLAAAPSQAESRLAFVDKYIDKFKSGGKLGSIDLDKIRSEHKLGSMDLDSFRSGRKIGRFDLDKLKSETKIGGYDMSQLSSSGFWSKTDGMPKLSKSALSSKQALASKAALASKGKKLSGIAGKASQIASRTP